MIHASFPTTTIITLFYCCEKVFIFMNIWMIGKNSMKHLTCKEDFYSNLTMEDITDADCMHAKRVGKNFEIKKLAEYHDLYV